MREWDERTHGGGDGKDGEENDNFHVVNSLIWDMREGYGVFFDFFFYYRITFVRFMVSLESSEKGGVKSRAHQPARVGFDVSARQTIRWRENPCF